MEQERARRFPKRLRLIQSQDFVDCKARGKRRGSAHMTIWFRANGTDHPRLGLAVSRKVGKSHDRNRFKRRVREIFRKGDAPFRDGFDYVIVAKDHAPDLDTATLTREITALIETKPLRSGAP